MKEEVFLGLFQEPFDPIEDQMGNWKRSYGPDPSNWPLPAGQSLFWKQWALALSAEAVARQWDSDSWPWPEDTMDDVTCWTREWFLGKTPRQTADEKQPYFDNATKAAE